MKLAEALQSKKFDVRLLDRYLSEGKITKAEYEKYLSTLEDTTQMSEEVDIGLLQ